MSIFDDDLEGIEEEVPSTFNLGLFGDESSTDSDEIEVEGEDTSVIEVNVDLSLYTSPSPRDVEESRMPSSA